MDNNDMILEDDALGFDDADFASETEADGNQTETKETQAEGAEVPTEDEQGAEHSEEPTTEQAEITAEDKQTEKTAEPGEEFELRFNKETRKVGREEVVTLAQKGLNHDRMQQQRDAAMRQLQEQTQWRKTNEATILALDAVAKQAGTDIPGLVKQLRINAHRHNGATEAEALAKIEKEDAEAKLTAYQQKASAAQQQQTQQQSRAQREFLEFNQRYPGVNIKDVPPSVIQKSASGEMSLANAYGEHLYEQLKAENQRLQQAIDVRRQNEANKQKSMGSVKTTGKSAKQDDFLTELFRD